MTPYHKLLSVLRSQVYLTSAIQLAILSKRRVAIQHVCYLIWLRIALSETPVSKHSVRCTAPSAAADIVLAVLYVSQQVVYVLVLGKTLAHTPATHSYIIFATTQFAPVTHVTAPHIALVCAEIRTALR